MAKKTKAVLEVDLGNNPGPVVFQDIGEIRKWVDSEREAWTWAADLSGREGGLAPIHNQQDAVWGPLDAQLRRIDSDPETLNDAVLQLGTILRENYAPRRSLHSETPEAEFVRQLGRQSERTAMGALGYFINQSINANDPLLIRGLIGAALFEAGVHDAAGPERWALTKLRVKFDKALEDARTKHDEIVDFIEEAKKRLANLEETYDELLTLKASVDYWRRKQSKHAARAETIGGITLGFGAFSAVALFFVAVSIPISAQDPNYLSYIPLFLAAFFLVWLLRVLVRQYLSDVHLADDAAERVTMVETFLALLRRENAVDPADRAIVLQAIFRPAATGIVRDDHAPPSIWDAASRMLGR